MNTINKDSRTEVGSAECEITAIFDQIAAVAFSTADKFDSPETNKEIISILYAIETIAKMGNKTVDEFSDRIVKLIDNERETKELAEKAVDISIRVLQGLRPAQQS